MRKKNLSGIYFYAGSWPDAKGIRLVVDTGGDRIPVFYGPMLRGPNMMHPAYIERAYERIGSVTSNWWSDDP